MSETKCLNISRGERKYRFRGSGDCFSASDNAFGVIPSDCITFVLCFLLQSTRPAASNFCENYGNGAGKKPVMQLVYAPSLELLKPLLMLPSGGRFGNLFDDVPEQWRMYADFIGSADSTFDLATPLHPIYFLPMASSGEELFSYPGLKEKSPLSALL
ncbi:Protein root UVB sensitive 5, partial [Cucurbita argyrosperma subsp. sororia]